MRILKTSVVFATVVLLLIGFSLPIYAQNNYLPLLSDHTTTGMQGDGTLANPYRVVTKQDLNSIRNNLDAHYVLMNDIAFVESDFIEGGEFYDYGTKPSPGYSALYGYGFDAIGDNAEPFSGVFDGNNYKIYGLYQSIDTSYRHFMGLFGYVDGATIKNLNMVNVDITATSNADIFTGAIAGYTLNTIIENCTVGGSVVGDNFTGGVAGYIGEGSMVTGCTNIAEVRGIDSEYVPPFVEYVTEKIYVAGIVGSVANATVIDCINNGKVFSTVKGGNDSIGCAAGIVAKLVEGFVLQCTNNGEITSKIRDDANAYETKPYIYASGVVGYAEVSCIENCKNVANITASSIGQSATAAGITAYDATPIGYTSSVSDCFNSGTVLVQSMYSITGGGVVGSSDSNIFGCNNEGSINGIITGDSAVYAEVGGVVGISTGNILTSYNSGNVEVTAATGTEMQRNLRIGGIAGRIFNDVVIKDCYNVAKITVTESVDMDTDDIYIGGIVGMMENSSMSSCYNAGAVSGGSRASGGVGIMMGDESVFNSVYTITANRILTVAQPLVLSDYLNYSWRLSDDQLRDPTNFAGFNFDTIWTMDGKIDYSYPELKVFNVDETATITSISIDTLPDKQSYAMGEKLDSSGGVIVAKYSNNFITAINLTNSMISGFNAQTLGEQTLVVTYQGVTTSFDIVVKTSSEIVYDNLREQIALLPQTLPTTQEEKDSIKEIVAKAAYYLKNVNIDDIRGQQDIIDSIIALEQALLSAEPKLTVNPTSPIIAQDVATNIALANLPVEVYGLALSEKGGGNTGTPAFTAWDTEYSVEVQQSATPSYLADDTMILQIKAKADFGIMEEYVNNFNLYTPVNIKLYVNDGFNYSHAVVEHTTNDPNQETEKEIFKVLVQQDAKGKFLSLTVNKFSEFIISGDNNVNPNASILLNIVSQNPNTKTMLELFSLTDTQYLHPIYSVEIPYSGTHGTEISVPLSVVAGVYDMVISKDGHLDFTITDVTVTQSQIDFTTHSNDKLSNIILVPGDANADNIINFSDLALIRNTNNFNINSTYVKDRLTDINGDKMTNVLDILIVTENYNVDKNICTHSFAE